MKRVWRPRPANILGMRPAESCFIIFCICLT